MDPSAKAGDLDAARRAVLFSVGQTLYSASPWAVRTAFENAMGVQYPASPRLAKVDVPFGAFLPWLLGTAP